LHASRFVGDDDHRQCRQHSRSTARPNKPSLVVITGTIDLADKDEFLRKIAPLQSAIVSFSSDGGSLLAGLQIGETIRLKNFSTLVPDQARCASSCALE
jgi:hypothetical protein